MMLRRGARSAAYTATAALLGARLGSRVERRVAGDNAVTRRALMAQRATMALAFRKAKQAT